MQWTLMTTKMDRILKLVKVNMIQCHKCSKKEEAQYIQGLLFEGMS